MSQCEGTTLKSNVSSPPEDNPSIKGQNSPELIWHPVKERISPAKVLKTSRSLGALRDCVEDDSPPPPHHLAQYQNNHVFFRPAGYSGHFESG